MKFTWISLLVTALLLCFTGCMRGGNVDEDNDGYLGHDDHHTGGIISDMVDDILPDSDDRDGLIPDDDILPDRDNVTDDGILNDNARNGFIPDREPAVSPRDGINRDQDSRTIDGEDQILGRGPHGIL
ncbi:MAG: hypothetical protein E7618_04895 [Ruminococcaceae bacterium]|nr:hypothetical protein [Oscillospiraceae bacterium]